MNGTEILTGALEQAEVAERRQGVRALLRHPLLTATGPDPEAFGLVRKHSAWLRDWFADETGWSLRVDPDAARLRKTPATTDDATRPARAGRGAVAFSRRRYVLLCLALAALERADAQITLGLLAERVLAGAADPALTAAGIAFTMEERDERSDLVAAVRVLLDLRVLHRVAGDERSYLDARGDALYDVDRRVLAGLLAARLGPSTVQAETLVERLAALVDDTTQQREMGGTAATRRRLARRLLDDPVVYHEDLDETEREYLRMQRSQLARRLADGTGFVPELRAEGLALLDPTGEATDLRMPEEGTDGHATLLLAEYLSHPDRRERTVPWTQLHDHTAGLITTMRTYWRRSVTEPGAERGLAATAVDRLEALGLVSVEPEGVRALPALVRYAAGEATVAGTQEQLL